MALHIDYYASLNSPWTHLGAQRLEALAARHRAEVRIFPVNFGVIFPASGGLPLPKRAPQRQAYRLMELERWRAHLGIPIHIKPRFFPANETQATFGYLQNRVLRPVHGTEQVDALVEELFPMEAMTDVHAFYGSGGDDAELQRRLTLMIESVTRFGAHENLDILPTSRYVYELAS